MISKELKRLMETWLFGFCMGVLTCILITYVNNGVR